MKRSVLLLMILSIFVVVPTIHAAPPPEEVSEIKEQAPLHVVGLVTDDVLIAEDSQHHRQQREFTLLIEEIIRQSHLELSKGEAIDVIYSYRPSWVETDGGKRMDIMPNDRVEIWLKQENGRWTPALGGNTVNHLKYVDHRVEHIPEPLLHKIKVAFDEQFKFIVLISILLISSLVIFFGRKLYLYRHSNGY